MSLSQVLATRARASFNYRINFQTVGYLMLDKMNRWCEKNCEGLWRSQSQFALYWQFEYEKDATLFMLRWGGAEGNKLK